MKNAARRLLGRPVTSIATTGLDALERDWTFRPSRADRLTQWQRWRSRGRWTAAPAARLLKASAPRRRWIAYFIYLPTGGLTAAHRFTLARLRQADAGLMVICAAPDAGSVPAELAGLSDVLYWKALPGFDFSAYALAIEAVVGMGGGDLLMLNDSILGPFVPVDAIWPRMRWDLTGFTASGQGQNHLQSYAFCLRGIDDTTLAALGDVLPADLARDDYFGVVLHQEQRFAAVAARTMSVGALWYARPERCLDPSLFAALPLVKAGFPFLKRGLLAKHAGIYPREEVLDMLRSLGHPTD